MPTNILGAASKEPSSDLEVDLVSQSESNW